MSDQNRRSIHIDCLGIKLDYGNDEQLSAILSDTSSLDAHQRYWLYHAIAGCISIDTKYFWERFQAEKSQRTGNDNGSSLDQTSLLPVMFAATNFMEGKYEVDSFQLNAESLSTLCPEMVDVMARSYIAAGQFTDALACYDAIDEKIGVDALTLGKRAAVLFSLNRVEDANAAFVKLKNSILEVSPQALQMYEVAEQDLSNALRDDRLETSHNESYWNDKEKIESTWRHYYLSFKDSGRFTNVGCQINGALIEGIKKSIDEDLTLGTVFNFGTFCGYPDYNLAKDHSDVQWVGYDRETLAIEMNRKAFQSDNLLFIDGDFHRLMSRLKPKSADKTMMLCHVRAFTEMMPRKFQSVYEAARDRRVKWLVGTEMIGSNPISSQYFQDGVEEKRSDIISNQTTSHDYRYFLDQAGYEIVEQTDEPIISYHAVPMAFPLMPFLYSTVFRTYRARLKT